MAIDPDLPALAIPFRRPIRLERADTAAEAVYLAALRMGYSTRLAIRASRQARKDALEGSSSGAEVVRRMKADLAHAARRSKA